MKLIVAAIFAIAAVSASPVSFIYDNEVINWDTTQAVPIQDIEGFWDGRDPIFVQIYNEEMEAREQAMREGRRIIGGTPATHGMRPFQCAQHRAGSLCGGSKISSHTILTAAHCMTGAGAAELIVGAFNRNVGEAPHQQRITLAHNAANTFLHPSYNPSNLNNDVGLFRIPAGSAGFTTHGSRQTIPMAPAGSGTFAGVTAVISGWGRTTNTGPASATLNQLSRPVITNAVCSQTYGTGTVVASTMCTSITPSQGTCNGDSGGPVTHAGQLIGVVSFVSGAGCVNAAGHPSGHARMSSFTPWVNANRIN